ncbi:hypothetical protein [Mangrovibacterium marinum]|uniref:Uncharacterized protein n=1 Tax=Mangrovibacterium marinum TaxID=1639118 RepID=A0A2T5C1S5_9BACT|nr:hypothetical protein [Mangrovibacterium marinum]PTN08548.1 hypothetical protein C8N47_108105 [Mangrovibacterium marinum]
MKNKFSTRDIITPVLSLLLISLLLFSCQEDDIYMETPSSSDFLTITGGIDTPGTLYDPINAEIYRRAFQRVLSVSKQTENQVEFLIDSGSEINISEEIYKKISSHLIEVISSGKVAIVERNGINSLVRSHGVSLSKVRLKSGSTESEPYARGTLSEGDNISQNVMNGLKDYAANPDAFANTNDIWDLSSGNFPASSNYKMSGGFTYKGYSFSYFVGNSCEAWDQLGNCPDNDINTNQITREAGGTYHFSIDNTMQLPIANISTSDPKGFEVMKEFLGW